MSTYTFTSKEILTGTTDLFVNSVVSDGDHVNLTGMIGSGPQTADNSSTPLTSPLTVLDTAVTTLNVPQDAAQLNIITITNTLNISEADSTVATKYFTVPTGTLVTIDVARCSKLYLEANTGSATVSFWFNMI